MADVVLAPEARTARRLGLLGGSFDPPHAGHLHAARAARAAFDLDHVVFVPAALPPHKPGRELAPPQERLAMLALLLEGEPATSVWAVELERPGPSYTVDTVRTLAGEVDPGTALFLIVGSDNLAGLATWRSAAELLELVQPVVVHRRGDALDLAGLSLGSRLRERLAAGFLHVEPLDASSSELRQALARGEAPPDGMLPPALAEYVARRGIYGGS